MNEAQFYIEDGTLLRVSNLEKLTEVVIPSNVKVIAPRVFANSQIRTLILNEGLEVISDEAFYKCTRLKEIVIPDTVKYIGKNAFYCCRGAKNIVIGKGVSVIDEKAFSDCNNVMDIIFRGTIEDELLEIKAYALYGLNLRRLELPDNLYFMTGDEILAIGSLDYIKYPNRDCFVRPIAAKSVFIPEKHYDRDNDLLNKYVYGSYTGTFYFSDLTKHITTTSYKIYSYLSGNHDTMLAKKTFTVIVDDYFVMLYLKYIIIDKLIFDNQDLLDKNFDKIKDVQGLKEIELNFDYVINSDEDYNRLEHLKQFYKLKCGNVVEKGGISKTFNEGGEKITILVEFNEEERKLSTEFLSMIESYPPELKERLMVGYDNIVDEFIQNMKNSKPVYKSNTGLSLKNNSFINADVTFQVELRDLMLSNAISKLYIEIINSKSNLDNENYEFKYIKSTMELINSLDMNSKKDYKNKLGILLEKNRELILEELNNPSTKLTLETLENKINREISNFNLELEEYIKNNKVVIAELLYIENIDNSDTFYGDAYRYLNGNIDKLPDLVTKFRKRIDAYKNKEYSGGIVNEFNASLLKLVDTYNIEKSLKGEKVSNLTYNKDVVKAQVISSYIQEISASSVGSDVIKSALLEVQDIVGNSALSIDDKLKEVTEIVYNIRVYENRLNEYNSRVKKRKKIVI